MAESRKLFRDDDYLARYDNEPFSSAAAETAFDEAGLDLGYYQRTNLDDMINNFIVAYVGEDKILPRVPRHEVAFFAQRAVQEFSYDIFHADKTIEVALNPDVLNIALPQDFVNLVKVVRVARDGREYTVLPAKDTKARKAIIQDDNYEYGYDHTGEITTAEESEGITRWQEGRGNVDEDYIRNYYYGSNYDGDFDYYSYYYNRGRRWGLDPSRANTSNEYVIDLDRGLIYFGNGILENSGAAIGQNDTTDSSDVIIGLTYISDGLSENGDLTRVYVPKLAEDAVYASILANLTKIRPSAAQIAPLYMKEASAKMRNAKIRLQNYNLEEMTTVMRNKSKWIKH